MVEALEVINKTDPKLRSFKKIYADGCETKRKKEVT